MCYNRMYALENPQIGQIVVSRMGHDKDRVYAVIAVLNKDFVLLADGKARTLDKPKQKRIKHVKFAGKSEEAAKAIESGKLTDADLRKIIKLAQTDKKE